MTLGTGTALLLLALFVLPGFVTLLIRERTYTVPGQREPFERLLSALYYAALIYGCTLTAAAVLGAGKQDLIDLYHGRKPLGELIAAAVLVGLLAPLVIAEAGRRWRYSALRNRFLGVMGISPGHDVESGWNQAFGSFDAAYVRVTTIDGRVVGGVFAKGSLAGYSEQARDLYLVQRWMLDDEHWFKAPADGTLGLWLPRESIASIEFYRLGPEP